MQGYKTLDVLNLVFVFEVSELGLGLTASGALM
jgi:hypothetical protein